MDSETQEPTMTASQIQKIRSEQLEHYRLCREADSLGIPTSLDDSRSPVTVDGLRSAIAAAKL
jgi:hypothetical protein